MHRVTGVVLAAAVAAGSCFVALAPGAAATSSSTVVPVVCGATLTHTTTLTHDLHCTTGPGLLLLGNITLNLGGHSIYGPATTGPGLDAIVTQPGATPTVTNGRVQMGERHQQHWGFRLDRVAHDLHPPGHRNSRCQRNVQRDR